MTDAPLPTWMIVALWATTVLNLFGAFAFFATLVSYWALGDLPFSAVRLGSADLWFSIAFGVWLYQSR